MKTINDLCALLKLKSTSVYSVDWDLLEAKINLTLPEDYKLICEILGAGSFGWQGASPDFLTIASPLISSQSSIPIAVFPDNIFSVSNSFKELVAEFPDNYPSVQFYPDVNGLINWGHDSNGNYYFWKPDGVSDARQWGVFVIKRNGQFIDFDGNLLNFLINVLTNQLVIASGFQIAGSAPTFVSALDRS